MIACLPLARARSSQATISPFASSHGRPSNCAGGDQLPVVVDHRHDRQLERIGELPVALVVRGHGHDRAGAVLHQHVVGDPDRDPLAVDRVGREAASEDTGLLARPPGRRSAGARNARVRLDLIGALGALDQPADERALGREHEERRAEQRVGPSREDGDVEVELLDAEEHLGALGAPDPVVWIFFVRSGQSIVARSSSSASAYDGDLEEPLRHVPRLDDRAAPPQRPSITCSFASTVWSFGHQLTGASLR